MEQHFNKTVAALSLNRGAIASLLEGCTDYVQGTDWVIECPDRESFFTLQESEATLVRGIINKELIEAITIVCKDTNLAYRISSDCRPIPGNPRLIDCAVHPPRKTGVSRSRNR